MTALLPPGTPATEWVAGLRWSRDGYRRTPLGGGKFRLAQGI
ncbi:hypothetical protein [Streptomyces sp. NPDC006691]